MTSALVLEESSPILQLLEREFSERSLGLLGGGTGEAVPWHLWGPALYGPLRDFLSRPGKEFRGALVTACYRLAGRKDAPPLELPMAIEALHAGSLIVDDIQDESLERRGRPALHRTYGVPTALNAGNWLYFWSLRLIDRAELPPATRLRAHHTVTDALLSCHYGQGLDLSVKLSDLEQSEVPGVVRSCSELKTGSLMGLAAALGALAGGASPEFVEAATRFGRTIGVGLQMLDDLSGLLNERRAAKGREDLARGRPTWVWAWLSTRLDDAAFDALVEQGRRVLEGGAPASLEKRLAALVSPFGKREAQAELERAFTTLRAVAGDSPVLSVFARELERLGRSYV